MAYFRAHQFCGVIITGIAGLQAMDSQKFCLKWDGFQGSVTSLFDSLRVSEELVDVTLCCDGQRVRAHRMMLSACSPYFRDVFKVSTASSM